ncbi:hypothetical protein [Pseudomethylobacillus aquaticus]|uniref:hypothetical protein n=1 Tax=Pseudomethylobacillus aquaticus TaxID=2676064 RepID=UPI0011CD7125|nr:hypothetical protein [Pseudomethylobacillus aquaticus]
MEHIYPDMDWNISRSHDKSLAPRCPHANVHRCPRYYQSYSLLGESGITTALTPETDTALLAKWKKTDLWPALAEHATSISGSNGKKSHFSNFCPEVAFDTFGLFASSLCRYADEIDRANAESWLVGNGRAFAKDWRWDWASLNPMHYSECPLYSQLAVSQSIVPDSTKEEIVSMKPGAFGFSVDLKKLISRFSRWWLSRHG